MNEFPPLFFEVLKDTYNEAELFKLLTSERSLYGSSALHFAVLGGNIQTVAFLLRHQFDPNLSNIYGETPLHWACKHGDVAIALLLLENEADLRITDAERSTPLHWAAEYDEKDIITLLWSWGAPLSVRDEQGRTPYQVAVENEAGQASRRILKPRYLIPKCVVDMCQRIRGTVSP